MNLPPWSILPFGVYLVLIAVLPMAAHRFWEPNRNKLMVAAIFSLVTGIFLVATQDQGGRWLLHSAKEYAAFIVVMIALYVTSGGIHLRGSLAGTPLSNTGMLALGALLASLIGTTGASMLLIRPLLRSNEKRLRRAHVAIFFIFIVSNIGGMLTPLGDPPLFLGYLRGVPFLWTLNLLLPWLLLNAALLVIFNAVDQFILDKEERERAGSQLEEIQRVAEPLRIEGKLNFLWLGGVVAIIFAAGSIGPKVIPDPGLLFGLQLGGMLALAGLSMASTPKSIRQSNRFTWSPIAEVAAVFIGIFTTMIPALLLLEQKGAALGVTRPWQFFWSSGLLSSVLDNAPTYLVTSSLAVGVVNQADPAARLDVNQLGLLAAHPAGGLLLAAIACGTVAMGAMTYIGNGPNFLVKAIAVEHGVKMPGFFGYLLWSGTVLIPLFVAVTLIFFRG